MKENHEWTRMDTDWGEDHRMHGRNRCLAAGPKISEDYVFSMKITCEINPTAPAAAAVSMHAERGVWRVKGIVFFGDEKRRKGRYGF